MNGRSGRGPVLDRTVPSRRRKSRARGASLKEMLVAHKREVRAALIVGVLFAAVAFTFVSALGPSSAESDPKIYIGSDLDFVIGTNGVVSGEGTVANPYIISGWTITGIENPAIEVRDTTKHFIITNVTITSTTGYGLWVGVYFWSVQNGSLHGCDISSCEVGVKVEYSSNCNVTGNIVDDMFYSGLFFNDNDGGNVTGNTISTCQASGIKMDYCTDIVVERNILSNNIDAVYGGGMLLFECENVLVFNNGFYGNTPYQAYDWDSVGVGNYWYKDDVVGGNYWDDYASVVEHEGEDLNGDGFWDDPYPIDVGMEDAYPLACDEVVIPEFSTVIVPVLLVLAVFLIHHRRSSAEK